MVIYLQALSAKGWSPKGRRGKESILPVEQQVGLTFKPEGLGGGGGMQLI